MPIQNVYLVNVTGTEGPHSPRVELSVVKVSSPCFGPDKQPELS